MASPMILRSLSGLNRMIGDTPVMELAFRPEGVRIFAKCEFMNPSGSVKDRLAKTILDDAELRGLLKDDSIILECSSGNTGVAFAMLGAARGYPVSIVLPARASQERRRIIEHFGAKVLTFTGEDYRIGLEITQTMAAEDSRYFLPRQFENPLNALDHENETGREILQQVPGPIDAFIAGYGTGGTLAGVSRALRKCFPRVKIFAMEPAEAALISGGEACCHRIEGLADGFVPALLKGVQIDGTICIHSDEAMAMARRLSREFGLLVGTSSGAYVAGAVRLAQKLGPDAKVVTLLCDRAERYFSTPLFAEEAAPAHPGPFVD